MIQSFPQQNGTVTMLQTRPSSSGGIMPGHSHSQSGSGQQYAQQAQASRNASYGMSGPATAQTTYRGIAANPVPQYSFTSTPALSSSGQWQPYGALRTSSSPSLPTTQTIGGNMATRPQYQQHASMTNLPTSARIPSQGMARDDSSLPSGTKQQMMPASQPTFAQVASGKAAPDRYRRPAQRAVADSSSSASSQSQTSSSMSGSAMPSGSGMATVVHLYNPRAGGQRMPIHRNSATLAARPHSLYGYVPGQHAADDMLIQRQPTEEELRRFRRRSMHSIDTSDYPILLTPQELKQQTEAAARRARKVSISDKNQKASPRVVPVPAGGNNTNSSTVQTRNGSSESLVSSRSSNSRPSSSTNRNTNASAPTASPASTITTSDDKSNNNSETPKSVNIPPRGSSSDAAKRVLTPSPLSKPATMPSEEAAKPASGNASAATPTKPPGSSQGPAGNSPAAQHLAAINEKGKSKNKTSRLRRAFSFGSAADFKKAADIPDDASRIAHHDVGKLRKEPDTDDLYEQEQARIAQKQEASGLGNNIYSGTKIFTGSTDNLSISSTASSASIMLRKMGKGMKKGGRSLAGLFRPKSVIGSPIGEVAAPEASQAAVSMITVEAERERVNVNSNADLSNQAGASGFPRLERNSLDAMDQVHHDSLKSDRLGSSDNDSMARKSIVGGERERAEVLGAIRKGILKTRSNSPSPSPQTGKGPVFELPMIPNVSDSPNSTAPSTPNADGTGNTPSITIGSEDYFMSALKLRQDSKSAPGTPQGMLSKRNATFSPRLIFHDTWPPQEYDRRGEIATCNRLTPMLAQQIKEELNSFKMEMEVHETSKIYTHFF